MIFSEIMKALLAMGLMTFLLPNLLWELHKGKTFFSTWRQWLTWFPKRK